MKSLPTRLFLLLIGAWALLVQAQNLELPACAKTCLATSIARSSCAPTDQTCICTDARLQQEVNDCVREKCTIREGLVTLNTTSTECGLPVQDKRQPLKTLAITLGAISPLFVILRMSARFMLMNQGGAAVAVGEDDWFILAALVVGVPNTVIIVSGLVDSGGLGLDIWRLDPETINSFGKYFYATAIMYFAEVTLLKMSLLWFYLRIFPSRGVRLALWATIAFNIAFGITFFLLGVLQCQPISYFWTKWDGEHEGTCVDINTVAWSNAGISIALDIWMLAVPLSQLQALRLNWKKKVGVALMFCVGTLVTVVSVLRLQSLVAFARSDNPTMDSWDVTSWSVIEINVGIMCTCLPSLRLLLVRIFPRLGGGGGSSGASRAYGGGGGGGRTGATLGGTGGTSRIGTVSKAGSVTRPKDAELRGGITMQRTYNVLYSDPDDEESLVQMHDLEPRRRIDFEKPGSSASSVTIAPAADSWMSGGGRRSG
ncbi:CFEM domain-containing protein [Pyricularia oryzae]|nr:CFEM domain-containing protein [Pyricularia oryzae]